MSHVVYMLLGDALRPGVRGRALAGPGWGPRTALPLVGGWVVDAARGERMGGGQACRSNRGWGGCGRPVGGESLVQRFCAVFVLGLNDDGLAGPGWCGSPWVELGRGRGFNSGCCPRGGVAEVFFFSKERLFFSWPLT